MSHRRGSTPIFDGGVLLLLAGLGLLFGIGRNEVRRFERAAAAEIASKLTGPNKKVVVRSELNGPIDGPLGNLKSATIRASHFESDGLPLFTEPERSKRGVLQTLNLILDDFTLCGLRVEHLEASIPDCRFDYDLAIKKRQIRLSQSGIGTGRVRLREQDLEAYIPKKLAEVRRVSLKLDRGYAFVEGFGEFLVVQTQFEVIAKLAIADKSKIVLTDAKVFFDGRSADEYSKKAILDALNPVIDLDKDLKLHGAVELERLELDRGILEAWGTTKIPVRPLE
ncbi:MAG: LmeA family phospholipid-binding protein [Armatimonadetes bacterium]|nr:LmeA family phospholipid-binding protein [Armatimonadota bacterium]